MTYELWILVWAAILGLVHILLGAAAPALKPGYLTWSSGPRDEPFDVGPLAGRLQRGLRNFLETFGIFAVIVIALAFADRSDLVSTWGARFYLIGRVLHIPLYAAGTPVARSLSWGLSLVGIIMCFLTLVTG